MGVDSIILIEKEQYDVFSHLVPVVDQYESGEVC